MPFICVLLQVTIELTVAAAAQLVVVLEIAMTLSSSYGPMKGGGSYGSGGGRSSGPYGGDGKSHVATLSPDVKITELKSLVL